MLVNSVYGRDARVRRYAEHLADEGHRADIICLAAQGREKRAPRPGIRIYAVPMGRYRLEGLGLVFNWAVCAVMMFVWVSKLDLKNRYDIVHVHNMPDFLVFCALLPRLRGCPILLDVHDPVPEVARSKLRVGPNHLLVRMLVILERLSIGFSAHVITATPAFKDTLVSRGTPRTKITVLINAADARYFRVTKADRTHRRGAERFTLLYVGTVAARYGLHVCVRSLPLLRKEIPGIRLKVVPKVRREGKALDDCLRLAAVIGVADLVEVVDPVPLEKMPEVMMRADIGVYPALSDCHMDVALSLKIPEMVNMRLPIVATRLPVLEELYGEDAIAFVPPDDHEAFASKIVELYRSPALRERLADNASLRASTMVWEDQFCAYSTLLESLLGRRLGETLQDKNAHR